MLPLDYLGNYFFAYTGFTHCPSLTVSLAKR